MDDTSDEIFKKQLEILSSKSGEERFIIGDELSSFGRKILESTIRNENPSISETELKMEIFRRCYAMAYPPEEFNKILKSMRIYLQSVE